MDAVQAFILSMKRESQNQYKYGKSHKEYKKPTKHYQETYVIFHIFHFLLGKLKVQTFVNVSSFPDLSHFSLPSGVLKILVINVWRSPIEF